MENGIVPSAVELREAADSVVMDFRRPSRFREPPVSGRPGRWRAGAGRDDRAVRHLPSAVELREVADSVVMDFRRPSRL